jgi:hypothetical protein
MTDPYCHSLFEIMGNDSTCFAVFWGFAANETVILVFHPFE